MDATFWAPFLRITSVILGIITAGSVADAYYSSSTVFFLRSSMWRGYKTAPGFYHYSGGFVGARVEELGEGWRSESDRLKGDVRDAGELGAQPVALTVETEPNRAQLREVSDEVGPLDGLPQRLGLLA